MKKKSMLFLILLVTGFSFAQKNNKTALERYSEVSYKIVMNGDAISSVNTNSKRADIRSILKHLITQQDRFPLYNTTFTFTGCSTIYDMTSNAIPQNIIQNPSNPDRIHIVCMYAPPGDGTGFPNRRTKYYYSTNRGQSWSFVSDVPTGIRTGYPAITLSPNGNALIANHGGTPNTTRYYYDAAPGLGSFTELYSTTMDYIWPRLATTNSLTNPVKFLSIVSPNGRDSCFLMKCLSISPAPGTFTYQMINSDQAERYSIARGTDGKIGLVYHNNDALFPNYINSLFFMESTDNGSTFGIPLEIFHAQINLAGDSLGVLTGLQIVYQENVPKVVFETIRQTTTSSFYPNSGKNKIRFWSTNLPGVDPYRSIVIADTSNVGFHPYINSSTTTNDVLSCICRPTIGTSADGTGLFVAFMVPSPSIWIGLDTLSFMNVWFTYSLNYGLNWNTPSKITPDSPVRDWTYPCFSPTSDNSTSNYYANILMLSDSVPGSYVNFSGNGESNAKYMFTRVEIPRTLPLAPNLMSPPNGSQTQPRNPNMKWYPVNNSATYRVQLSLNSNFTTILFDSANIIPTNLQLAPNSLSPGSQIYWRVNATNSSGSGPWSVIWNFKTDTVPFYSVSGTVRYKDNNQPIAGGYIKIMKVNPANLVITTFDSVLVQSTGTYAFPSIRKDADYYISPYPNSTPPNDNFIPTYYPSEILWERATPVNVNANLTNIDINVYRTMDTVGYNTIIGQVFKQNNPNLPIDNAVIYAKKDASFHRFSLSNQYGQYALNNLLSATYKLSFSRLGYRSDSTIVTLISGQYLNSVNLSMIPFYTGIENNGNTIPTTYKLYQNYPNPFNPITKIKFDLPKTSDVLLRIYDVTGREIVELINLKLQAGRYELTWNAAHFSSGLYFIKIETNSFTDTKKIILIK